MQCMHTCRRTSVATGKPTKNKQGKLQLGQGKATAAKASRRAGSAERVRLRRVRSFCSRGDGSKRPRNERGQRVLGRGALCIVVSDRLDGGAVVVRAEEERVRLVLMEH